MEYNITYREKDGGWQYIISYKDKNGKWRQRSKQGFKRQREAKKAADIRLDGMKESLELQKNSTAEYEDITFKELCDMHIEHLKLYREPSTIYTYEAALSKLEILENMEVKRITSLHMQKCVDKMIKDGLNPSSVSEYVAKAQAMFNSAIKTYKIISINPASGVEIPKAKNNEDKIKALTSLELKDLLEKITNREHYIASVLAAHCGLRLGEIGGLTWDNVNEIDKTLKIEKQWKKLKSGLYGFGTLKSANSYRVVPIPTGALRDLLKYKKEVPTNIMNRIIPYSHQTTLGGAVKQTYKEIGYDISIHSLRHTYATRLVSNGIDFTTAAKLLGHDVDQTINTYSHVTSDMLDRASKIIEGIF